MAEIIRGARPIQSSLVEQHYKKHQYCTISLEDYVKTWRSWLTSTSHKSINGLQNFICGNYTHGTSQVFDHFVLKHSGRREIVNFKGDFQYHSCISKHQKFRTLDNTTDLSAGQALIISAPFSDFGKIHPGFDDILDRCTLLEIPICLDLAYWGISKNINVDLDHPCIQEVTSSLSKPFYTLENHRCGIRFSREYLDDGISMINEVKMQNLFSMSLAVHYMNSFDADWAWRYYGSSYSGVCDQLELDQTDTLIFGTSKHAKYDCFNRGIPGNNRICISEFFKDIT